MKKPLHTTRTLQRKSSKRRRKNYLVLMYSLFAVGYVIIGRGSVYNGFVPVAYGTVILLIFEYLTSHIKILRKTNRVVEQDKV